MTKCPWCNKTIKDDDTFLYVDEEKHHADCFIYNKQKLAELQDKHKRRRFFQVVTFGSILDSTGNDIRCILHIEKKENEAYLPRLLFEEANVTLKFGMPFRLIYGIDDCGFTRTFILKDNRKSQNPTLKKKIQDKIKAAMNKEK